MALTKEFKQTVKERAEREPEFRQGLLNEAVNEILSGNLESGKLLMKDYINSSITFPFLAKKLHKNDKSLQRMFSSKGNPTMSNFCEILKVVQKKEGIKLQSRAG